MENNENTSRRRKMSWREDIIIIGIIVLGIVALIGYIITREAIMLTWIEGILSSVLTAKFMPTPPKS